MIVDIGGGTCNVAILSINGIVVSQSLKIGGDDFDEAIVKYVKNTFGLMIGEQAAEEIKIHIGTAFERPEKTSMEVNGRDLVTGTAQNGEDHIGGYQGGLKGHGGTDCGTLSTACWSALRRNWRRTW